MPSTIQSLSQKYSINTSKRHFPVNTMRLLYLLIADGLTDHNSTVTDAVNQIIPKISATFDARDAFLQDNKDTNPLLEIQACRQSINDIFAKVNTPIVHHTFDLLFSDLYPLQENLLISLDRHLSEDKLSPNDLSSILKIRAMDSVVYSSIIFQIIQQHQADQGNDPWNSTNYSTSPIHWQINTTLQINDIADAIIHAKQDLAVNAATIIDIAKRVGGSPEKTIQVLNDTLDKLLKQSQKFPFPQPLQKTINDFNQSLIDTIKNPPQPKQPTPQANSTTQFQPTKETPTPPNPQPIPDPTLKPSPKPQPAPETTPQPQPPTESPTTPNPTPTDNPPQATPTQPPPESNPDPAHSPHPIQTN